MKIGFACVLRVFYPTTALGRQLQSRGHEILFLDVPGTELRGRNGGRPRKLKTKDIQLINALMQAGKLPVQDIADRFGVSRSTLYRMQPGQSRPRRLRTRPTRNRPCRLAKTKEAGESQEASG